MTRLLWDLENNFELSFIAKIQFKAKWYISFKIFSSVSYISKIRILWLLITILKSFASEWYILSKHFRSLSFSSHTKVNSIHFIFQTKYKIVLLCDVVTSITHRYQCQHFFDTGVLMLFAATATH